MILGRYTCKLRQPLGQPVLAWPDGGGSEGFDTPDLKEAKALLEELS